MRPISGLTEGAPALKRGVTIFSLVRQPPEACLLPTGQVGGGRGSRSLTEDAGPKIV